MNGALFAAFRVIANLSGMVGCSRTNHGFVQQFGMFIYMLYFMLNQVLSFFTVGSYYVSIKLFFTDYLNDLTRDPEFIKKWPNIAKFFDASSSELNFALVFTYAYFIMLILTCLISLAMPLPRAMFYITLVSIVFTLFTLASFTGMIVFMIHQGFWVEKKVWSWLDDK